VHREVGDQSGGEGLHRHPGHATPTEHHRPAAGDERRVLGQEELGHELGAARVADEPDPLGVHVVLREEVTQQVTDEVRVLRPALPPGHGAHGVRRADRDRDHAVAPRLGHDAGRAPEGVRRRRVVELVGTVPVELEEESDRRGPGNPGCVHVVPAGQTVRSRERDVGPVGERPARATRGLSGRGARGPEAPEQGHEGGNEQTRETRHDGVLRAVDGVGEARCAPSGTDGGVATAGPSGVAGPVKISSS